MPENIGAAHSPTRGRLGSKDALRALAGLAVCDIHECNAGLNLQDTGLRLDIGLWIACKTHSQMALFLVFIDRACCDPFRLAVG